MPKRITDEEPKKIYDFLEIKNAKIGFRNFEGKAGNYNPPGRRKFAVFLEEDMARKLEEDGWNIKTRESRDPDDPPQFFLEVFIRYDILPPKIYLVTKNKTLLDETELKELDTAEIERVDLQIRPYNWEYNGKTGVKAYVKKMFVTVADDPFEEDYRDIPYEDED